MSLEKAPSTGSRYPVTRHRGTDGPEVPNSHCWLWLGKHRAGGSLVCGSMLPWSSGNLTRCWLRDARAGIMFYIHQCSCAGWPARSRASQGCPGERPRIPGEKGHVLQHHLAPEMGTTNCRIEENPLCSSCWSQTFPCVLQPLVPPQPWAPPCKFPSWSVHQVHLGIERGGRTMHQPLPTRAFTTDKASKLIQHPTPWGE